MTEFQVISEDPRNRRLSGAAEEALLRRLLHGTVFDPRAGAAAATTESHEPEERRAVSAHCRHAMYYGD
ncbi:hypothetical protein ACIQ9P_09235 [Kitasatospora sp. NPDC094019]|uniref:hypothetical protein n=1 Tax=Kitasatospora sp. NPDC094019 TaxID=3364091 RepID=UPI0038077477